MSVDSIKRLTHIPWLELPSWIAGNRLQILMFHSISDNLNDPHAIGCGSFIKQLEYIEQNQHKVISLKQGLDRLNQKQSLYKTVVLTFDDAYQDFIANALPVLRKFNYPATVFVPTDVVGKTASWDSFDQSKQIMNWDELAELDRNDI